MLNVEFIFHICKLGQEAEESAKLCDIDGAVFLQNIPGYPREASVTSQTYLDRLATYLARTTKAAG